MRRITSYVPYCLQMIPCKISQDPNARMHFAIWHQLAGAVMVGNVVIECAALSIMVRCRNCVHSSAIVWKSNALNLIRIVDM